MQNTFNIFVEVDQVLKSINDDNYESYNELFFSMLSDINRIKRKTIFILRDKTNKKTIKKYFHEDFFEYFELINMENLEKVEKFINERNLDRKNSIAILSQADTIEAFREVGIFTAFLKVGDTLLSTKKGLEIVDYQNCVFNNLFNINYENLFFECNKFHDRAEEDNNEDDI